MGVDNTIGAINVNKFWPKYGPGRWFMTQQLPLAGSLKANFDKGIRRTENSYKQNLDSLESKA